MSQETPQRWRPAPELHWSHYPDSDEWVVYHPESATAYLVTDSAHALWALVSDGQARTLDEIVTKLTVAGSQVTGAELTEAVRDTLGFMDRAGLLKSRLS